MRIVSWFLALAALLSPLPATAAWVVVNERIEGADAGSTLARMANESGHTLAFYRDGAGAIRARFTLPAGLVALEPGHCPTLQVDRWAPVNRSISDAACLATTRWAEFVVAQVMDRKVVSDRMLQLMNGNQITFRYRLSGGDYRDTAFSLTGSKRALIAAIGADVTFAAP